MTPWYENEIRDSYRGFLKWWYPTTMGFPTKNDHFGVWNGGTTIKGTTRMDSSWIPFNGLHIRRACVRMRALLQEFSQLLNLDFLEVLHRGSNLTADQWKKKMTFEDVHPRRLTWNLKNDGWKMSFLLGFTIFRGYVKFQGGISYYLLLKMDIFSCHLIFFLGGGECFEA